MIPLIMIVPLLIPTSCNILNVRVADKSTHAHTPKMNEKKVGHGFNTTIDSIN